MLFLKRCEGLHHVAASADHLLDLSEVINDCLVLLPLLEELQGIVCESLEVGVGRSQRGFEFLDGLEDS